MRLLQATLYHKVVKAVPQLIVVGQLLPCALAFEQLAGPSEVQLHSFASCLQHIHMSLDQLPELDTPAQTVTISLLTAGVKPSRLASILSLLTLNNLKVGNSNAVWQQQQ